MSHLFTAGSYVEVSPVAKRGKPNSEGGAGYIIGINSSENDSNKIESFDVQYVLQKKLSKEVQPSRVVLKNIDNGRSRKCNSLPPLLSRSYPSAKRVAEASQLDQQPIKPKRSKKNGLKNTEDLLLMTPKDVCDYLCKKNSTKERGWLRVVEAGPQPTSKQLSAEEKQKLLAL